MENRDYNIFVLQLALFPAILASLLIFIGGSGIYIAVRFQNSISDLQESSVGPTQLIQDISRELQTLTINLLLSKNGRQSSLNLVNKKKIVEKTVRKIDRYIGGLREYEVNEEFRGYLNGWVKDWSSEKSLILNGLLKEPGQNKVTDFSALVKKIQNLNEYNKADMKDKVDSVKGLARISIQLIAASLLISLLIGGWGIALLTLNIKKIFVKLYKSESQIARLMEHIQLGIISFNLDQSLNMAHSRIAEKMFGTDNFNQKDLSDLFHLNKAGVEKFSNWLDVCKNLRNFKKWKKIQKIAPISLLSMGDAGGASRVLSIRYEPVVENQRLVSVMAIVEDVSQETRLKEKLKEAQEENKFRTEGAFACINNRSSDVEGFLGILHKIVSDFPDTDTIPTDEEKIKPVFMLVHDCKARAMALGMNTLGEVLHGLEGCLNELSEPGEDPGRVKRSVMTTINKLESCHTIIRKFHSMIQKADGESFFSLDQKTYQILLQKYKNTNLSFYQDLLRISYENIFSRKDTFVNIVVEYCLRTPEKSINFVMEGEDFKVDPGLLDAVTAAMTHLIRNSCDHGIENRDVRIKAGKNPEGIISVFISAKGSRLILDYKDDGRGIITEPGRDLSVIFEPSYSTAERVTDISGRGMGMPVAKNRIEGVGGTIQVNSVSGQFTGFVIDVPIVPG